MLKNFLKYIYLQPKTIYQLSVWLYLHNKIKEQNSCSGFCQKPGCFTLEYFQKIKALRYDKESFFRS